MPYLRKKPFQRLHVSSDYRDDDEVFHCEVTNEVFKDYNEYCERIILCNSTIWSCSITGKTNMTYEEALACEENAKASLKEFPMELRIPILYLASRTTRSSFNEMMEDVYQYARDRYFIGEMVEASFTEDSWCECHVLQVIEPTDDQIKLYLKENPQENPQDRQFHPPAKLFRYEIEQLDCGDNDISQLMIVEASQVRRKKQLYSRERNKIFLRMLCHQAPSGTWIVKDEIQQKYGIPKVRFDSIFAGPIPDFSNLPKRPIVMKQKQGTLDKFLTSNPSKSSQDAFKQTKPVDKNSYVRKTGPKGPRMNGKYKENQKARAEEEKAKKKEERLQKREKKKEERLKLAAFSAYLRDWHKPREDLECEDLRPIPEGTPVSCSIPDDSFGDFVMILEFLHFFHEELDVSSYFPSGLTFEMLEKALLAKETSGLWSDLLQLFLANIFKHQAEEEDEIHEANNTETLPEASMDHGVSSMAEAVKLATLASTWSQTHQGCQLSEVPLDHVTVSEILRQHLLSSGGRISEVASKWRYSQRGGYTNHDDPALSLRIMEARILRTLGHRSVGEFEMKDKLIVATCLINQLLTFASIRDVIEERYEKLHQARRELKSFIVAEQRKEKEEREKMKEEREKMKEESVKLVDEIVDERPKKTRGSREEEKKREEYEGRLGELRQAAKDDQMMLLLGMDRAFRRYWRLLSVPGIFVEDNEVNPGVCIEGGTNYMPELQDKATAEVYLRRKFEDEFSDNKENDFNKSKKKKTVSFTDKKDKNGLKSPRKESDVRKSLMACTGDKECPVHQSKSPGKWRFLGRQEDIEALINGLSIRGIREGELRNNLIQESESISSALINCPKHKLNPEVYPPSNNNNSTTKSRKSKQENTNLNFPPDVPIDEVLELTLRDYVLDLEDKLKAGCLGILKVKDRDSWRKEVGTSGIEEPVNTTIDKIKNESRNSRPGTPDSEVGTGKTYRDPGKYLGPPGDDETLPDGRQQANIKQMAWAILQLFHAVETKYLKRPLGNDEKDKKYSCEEVREKWEQSLLASTSWSQLFLHLNTLEGSVAWGRSALNARCRICRKCKDAEHMLLCDGCNKGQHLYCLKPKLTSVPDGDWFCGTCRPKEVKPKPKARKRKKFEEEDEEEIIKEEDVAEEEEKEEDTADNSYVKIKKMETCSQCNSTGSLFGCDICNKLFHLDCVEPPMSRAPRGRWLCHECKNLKKNATRFVRGRERERETERQCAAAARFRIHGFAKSLLSTESSNWWDDGSTSEEVEQRQTRRATKRAAAVQDKTLHDLLNDVMHHRDSWPFLSPVRTDEVPDYYEFIKRPMDFGTIKGKLEAGIYENDSHLFFTDCLLIFDNCHTYNADHSAVYKAGMRLSKYFEKKSKEMGFNYDEETRAPPTKRFKDDSGPHKSHRNGNTEIDES
ncbi:bromodomain adjacent to zinc finger domain protein 1A isoform X2 [Fopius arisanus]|uniref:Bromodomain adjacent to zinc finger domain protein 1A n=1 Tax=Fopius arisanus TaxID=64838 RepID=A0A9R1T6D5_9HYME|nr:PREDICTED: bromodomain adjacent to zinc finger domain protein 1A isoform X2 [Fopius arisanus]